MRTSYFAKTGNVKNVVAISRMVPPSYKGRRYLRLAPPFWLLKKFRKDGDKKFYVDAYQREVLDNLDPKQVFDELCEDAVLVCYEKSKKFCHRHLVAEWLMTNLNVRITEL